MPKLASGSDVVVISIGGATTVSVVSALTSPSAAEIVETPVPTAVARPPGAIVATAAFVDAQLTSELTSRSVASA